MIYNQITGYNLYYKSYNNPDSLCHWIHRISLLTSSLHLIVRISYLDQKIWKCSWHFLIFHIEDKRNIVNDFGNDKMLLVLVHFKTLKCLVECLLICIFCSHLKDQTTWRNFRKSFVESRRLYWSHCISKNLPYFHTSNFFINFFNFIFLLKLGFINAER